MTSGGLHTHTSATVQGGSALESADQGCIRLNCRSNHSGQAPQVRVQRKIALAVLTGEHPAAVVLACLVLRKSKLLVDRRANDHSIGCVLGAATNGGDALEDGVSLGVAALGDGLDTGGIQDTSNISPSAGALQQTVFLSQLELVNAATVDLGDEEGEVFEHLIRVLDVAADLLVRRSHDSRITKMELRLILSLALERDITLQRTLNQPRNRSRISGSLREQISDLQTTAGGNQTRDELGRPRQCTFGVLLDVRVGLGATRGWRHYCHAYPSAPSGASQRL